MKVNVGDSAPNFTLPADGNETVSLGDFKGQKVVLYFYPKDDTPGCTLEAKDFTKLAETFADHNTVVIGVSKDNPERHDKFRDKYKLRIRLVSDQDGNLCDLYGVWKEKSMYGRTFMGIERTTFLIDEKGVIQYVWNKVKVKGHAQEVLHRARKL